MYKATVVLSKCIIFLQYEFPQKKLDRIRLMSEDQKMEYIEALHKDNKYIGDLAVEARSGQQRVSPFA